MRADSTFAPRPHNSAATTAPRLEAPRPLTCEERWQRDMLDIRLALYKRSNLVRESLVSAHAWERNVHPERSHVSMAEVIHALLHRDAHIISEHSSPQGPVRVIEGYTWEGTRLHLVVGLNRDGGRRVSLITYWDPAIPAREPVQPAPRSEAVATGPESVPQTANPPASPTPAPPRTTLVRRALLRLWQTLLRLSGRRQPPRAA